MRTRGLFWFLITCFAYSLMAQSESNLEKYRVTYPAPVEEVKATEEALKSVDSAYIFTLSADKEVQFIIDTITSNNKNIRKAKGYRIAVYNGPDKDEIKKVKEYVYSLYPDINIISEYRQPDYKIRVGDFISRYEAFEALGKISLKYPDALVVPEIVDINPPKTKTNE